MHNLISVYPSKERAIVARRSFYNTVMRSLVHLKSVAESAIVIPSFSIEPLLSNTETTHSLDPEIFYLHDMLLSAMRSDDVEMAKKRLVSISQKSVTVIGADHSASIPIVASLGTTEWEKFVVAEVKKSIEADTGQTPELNSIDSDEAVEVERKRVLEALDMINRIFPEMGQEIEAFLHKLRLFTGRVSMGITDVRMFGCMFIRVPRPKVDPMLYYIEHICHEVSHMYLNAAMSLDPVILNDRDKKFKSPIRQDSRTMFGVFHATFVTSRIVQAFTKLSLQEFSEDRATYLDQQLVELRDGIAEVSRFGELTPTGKMLVEEFKEVYWWAVSQKFWRQFDSRKDRLHRFGGGVRFGSDLKQQMGA